MNTSKTGSRFTRVVIRWVRISMLLARSSDQEKTNVRRFAANFMAAGIATCAGFLFIRAVLLPETQAVYLSRDLVAESAPLLTAHQRGAVNLALGQDHRVAALFRRHRPAVRLLSPWLSTNGDVQGVMIVLAFSHPLTLHGEWISLTYNCASHSDFPFARRKYEGFARRVRAVIVLVRFHGDQVVSIQPDSEARFFFKEGKDENHVMTQCNFQPTSSKQVK